MSDLFIPSKAAIRVSYLVKDEYKVFTPKSGKHGSQANLRSTPFTGERAKRQKDQHRYVSTLHRKNGSKSSFRLRLSGGDTDIEREDMKIEVDLHELGTHDDAFVLMCAEDDNRFERYMSRQEHCKHTPVLITADDDLLSPYGIAKWRAALRSSRDACMFAGPCTADRHGHASIQA